MYKSIVFAVALYLFLALSNAGDDITIYNLLPKNGAVVSDCPSFSWSQRPNIPEYTITVYKQGVSDPVINEVVIGSAEYKVTPSDVNNLLPRGTYSWNVTTSAGDRSPTQTFSINELSCLPPKYDNKVDNTYASFNQRDSKTPSGSLTAPWKAKLHEGMQVNGVNVSLFAPEGENIYTLELHETYWPNTASNPLNETLFSIATSNPITPVVGDNLITFRYVFYSTGNSTVHIELQDSVGNIAYLGCVGATEETDIPCQEISLDNHGTLYSLGIRVQPGEKAKWDVFNATLPPRNDTKPVTIRLRYQRALREKGDNSQWNHANFLFIASEFVFGQCSTIPLNYYDGEDVRDTLIGKCPLCESAGMRCPSSFWGHCFSCEDAKQGSNCASVSYCSYCSSPTAGICQPSSAPRCQGEVNCSARSSKGACNNYDYCEWCEIDGICSFRYDDKSVCSTCSSFTDKDTCNAKSSCNWCSTLNHCLNKVGESCPSCEIISKDSCTVGDTEGFCQYCYNQSKCLNSDESCTSICGTLDQAACNNNEDCHWCSSQASCLEQRIVCSDCEELTTSECVNSKYPGCQLCPTLYCTSKSSECPVCDGRTRETCGFEKSVPINCHFCNSTQMCTLKSQECKNCGDLAEAGDCNALSGCSFCKSEQVCKNNYDTLTECDCLGLSAASCTTHTKGCCWSKTDSKCYDYGDEKCKNPLDTTYIIIIAAAAAVFVATAAILIPVLICCCKPKKKEDVEMQAPATIVVLPEGQPSMVVGQESLQSVNVDPATAVSVDETTTAGAGMNASASMQDMQNMQNMIAQQQMLNTMMAQQQMSMMMNPMMMNSMNMMNMSGMAGMSGMNSMGMDMNSMNMTGGMMNSMNMTGGMNSMNMTGGAGSMNMAGDPNSMNMASSGNPMNMTGGMASMQSGMPSSQGPM